MSIASTPTISEVITSSTQPPGTRKKNSAKATAKASRNTPSRISPIRGSDSRVIL